MNVRDLDRACGDLKSNDTQGYAFEGGKLYWVFLIDFGATVSRKFTSSLPPTTRYVDNPAVASESSTTASSLYNHVDDLKRNLEETRQKMEDLSQKHEMRNQETDKEIQELKEQIQKQDVKFQLFLSMFKGLAALLET